jgi:hypothetical protein
MKRAAATRSPSIHRVDLPLSDLDSRRLWALARYLNVDPLLVLSTAIHLLAISLKGNPLCRKQPLQNPHATLQSSEPGSPQSIDSHLSKVLPRSA